MIGLGVRDESIVHKPPVRKIRITSWKAKVHNPAQTCGTIEMRMTADEQTAADSGKDPSRWPLLARGIH